MNNKNLYFRYFFSFFLFFFFIILILDYLKEKEFTLSLNSYKNQINKEYFRQFDSYKNISELIYFNEFIKQKEILDILKNDKDLILLKKQLNSSFENSFLFYKTLGLKEASFYSLNNDLILSMEENQKDNFIAKIVQRIITNKKDETNYKIENEKIILLFSKPIFDEKLNFLGVINLEFDFETIVKDLEKNSDSKFRIFSSNNFHLNEKIFFNMRDSLKKDLVLKLNNKEETMVISSENLMKIPIVFIKIADSGFYKNTLFLLAYDESKNNRFTKINSYFDFLFVVITLIFLVLLYLFYRKSFYKNKKEILNKKYQELLEQIDNYIIKVDTDLQGNIISATKPFLKLCGYTKEELIGKNINILRHIDVSKTFFEKLWRDLRENDIWEGEIKNKDKYGNSYWIKAVIFPIYNLDGEKEGYSSIRFNITDTKQLIKINRLLKEDLSDRLNDIKIKDKTLIDTTKVQLMSKILDSLGHQWKIPISKISFEVQKLQKFDNNLNKNALLNIEKNIESELKNLSNMLNEIKYLFSTRNSEKTNLLSIVSESIFSLKDEFKTYDMKVKFDIKPEINMSIPFNELKNIIVNILKHSIEQVKLNKSENISIFISAISEDLDENNDVVIKIEDNIKGENKKIIIDDILSSNEDKYFDTNLYLSKLFIEKNKGLFWCNNTIFNTAYFIKLHKEVKK